MTHLSVKWGMGDLNKWGNVFEIAGGGDIPLQTMKREQTDDCEKVFLFR